MTRGQDERARLWAAIADPSRRQVIDIILARGEATATGIATELPITRQGVAKHLAVLEAAGLVERRRHGKEVAFAVRPDRLDLAARWMADLATEWDSRLEHIKRLAEASASEQRRPQ
jgi:ArsR family transcriptional regulator, cadmium/lead-responsive transcriptional repressor